MRKALLLSGAAAVLLGSASLVYAQLEGADRGIPPIDSSSHFEVTGIDVNVSGENAMEAREEGWKLAQKLGWKKLWSRTVSRPEDQAPDLSESELNQIMSGIVVEQEQIGPTRYIARLGVLFDRARTGQMLGVGADGAVRRSAPMLVIPVMRTGGVGYAFEFRSPWQYAWAQFRTSTSPIDYVRPVGNGIDPLLLNAAQTGRRSRGWWRALLDQYGAADVVMPEVTLRRAWPGGPAIARFVARYGPDGQVLGSFELRAENQDQIPQMMAQGVQRVDAIYIQAFHQGILSPDPTLITPAEFLPPPPPPPPAELPDESSSSRRGREDTVSETSIPTAPQIIGPDGAPVPFPTPQAPPPPPPPPGFGPRTQR